MTNISKFPIDTEARNEFIKNINIKKYKELRRIGIGNNFAVEQFNNDLTYDDTLYDVLTRKGAPLKNRFNLYNLKKKDFINIYGPSYEDIISRDEFFKIKLITYITPDDELIYSGISLLHEFIQEEVFDLVDTNILDSITDHKKLKTYHILITAKIKELMLNPYIKEYITMTSKINIVIRNDKEPGNAYFQHVIIGSIGLSKRISVENINDDIIKYSPLLHGSEFTTLIEIIFRMYKEIEKFYINEYKKEFKTNPIYTKIKISDVIDRIIKNK